MIFDEETLIELEDYIKALSENVGLSPETEIDVYRAIVRQRRQLKNLTIPVVSKPKGTVCPKCNGSGGWNDGLEHEDCLTCGGTGQTDC